MGENVTHKQHSNIGPSCCAEMDEKELLIIPDGNENPILNAYIRTTNRLKWSMESILPGMEKNMIPAAIVTDGHGHLFILDRGNDCVHMMSVDGLYFGVIVRGLVQGMGELKEISWSEKTSSLIVAHLKSETWILTNVRFGEEDENEETVPNMGKEESVSAQKQNVNHEEQMINDEEKKVHDEDTVEKKKDMDKENKSSAEGRINLNGDKVDAEENHKEKDKANVQSEVQSGNMKQQVENVKNAENTEELKEKSEENNNNNGAKGTTVSVVDKKVKDCGSQIIEPKMDNHTSDVCSLFMMHTF